MDPIRNPYTPGAGTRSSELAGRGGEIDDFKILLARLRACRPEQIQIVKQHEFRALHSAMQKQLPVTLAAAGLPQVPGLAGEARSYPERLFRFTRIGGSATRARRARLSAALSTVRQRLLDRSLIYATEDYGHVDFTVPRFDELMRRHVPFKPAAPRTTGPRCPPTP